jgi:uracil-DNA glycosylase
MHDERKREENMDPSRIRMHPSWLDAIGGEFDEPYMQVLRTFLLAEKAAGRATFPPSSETFRALELVAREDVKVVILGQDPYHGPGQAHGLSFSVRPGVAVPPSLQNIYKELNADLGLPVRRHGFLESWAKQGVLLLNDSLSVERGKAGSHRNKGWERFTAAVIRSIDRGPPAVFILWGRNAKEKAASVDAKRHLVIATSHPSPMGDACNKGFFGSRPFSRANAFLEAQGRGAIDWSLPETVS